MNDMTHSFVIDRATVAPAVIHLPIAWAGTFDEAVTNLERAEALVAAVDASDEVALDVAVNAMHDAVYDLMETPAPNVAGLLIKLVAMEREDRSNVNGAKDWRDSIIAEATNLAAQPAQPAQSALTAPLLPSPEQLDDFASAASALAKATEACRVATTDREIDGLADDELLLAETLIGIPAPDFAAAVHKLRTLWLIEPPVDCVPELRASVLADLDRLAAASTVLSGAVSDIEREIDSHYVTTLQQDADWNAGIRRELGIDDENPHLTAGSDLYDRIEALPCTLENARIRAKAILDIYDGDLSGLVDEKTTQDFRLAKQIVETMLIGA